MPQTDAAKKALRAASKRRVINDRWRRKYRAAVKAARTAITDGDAKKGAELYKNAQSMLDRAARRNILHPNTAARKKAQLASSFIAKKS